MGESWGLSLDYDMVHCFIYRPIARFYALCEITVMTSENKTSLGPPNVLSDILRRKRRGNAYAIKLCDNFSFIIYNAVILVSTHTRVNT